MSDTDEDGDKVCSFIVQLMQKDRRKIKDKGEKLIYIGFLVYRVRLKTKGKNSSTQASLFTGYESMLQCVRKIKDKGEKII